MSRFNITSTIVAVVVIACCLVFTTNAQDPVLDTDGQPVRRGVRYFILPAATDVAGGLNLFLRNGTCPYYVGQEPLAEVTSLGRSVVFEPFASGETIVRETRDLTISFPAFVSICIQSTSWRVADEVSGRRLIAAGANASYFNIIKNGTQIYELSFCPSESCPTCISRPRCGSVGILEENGQRLVALDGRPFYFSFLRVQR